MRPVTLLGVLTLLAACPGSGPDKTCVDVNLDCTPQYDPTFHNIHTNTLEPTCAPAGTACHAAAGARGGLIMEGEDQAYQLLVEDARARVIPGDPACSEIMRRVSFQIPGLGMPPGGPMLEDGEICAIAQWIADGAQR